MDYKRVLNLCGILLIVFAFILVLSSSQILTGFAILEEQLEKISGTFYGIILIVGGIIMIGFGQSFEGNNLENRLDMDQVSPQQFADRFFTKERDEQRRSIILDTSAILSYEPSQVAQILERFGHVYVPDSVLNEIENPALRSLVLTKSLQLNGYASYKDEARHILEQTEKPQLRKFLIPYLTNVKHITSNREATEISNKTTRLRKIMEKEGWTLDDTKGNEKKFFNSIMNYLNKHCEVSETDVDVLAMGLYRLNQGHHVLIGERDIDLRDAVKLIKLSNKRGRDIDYIEPYQTTH